jgi:lipoprotein-anchoring transpeptidase ErfK/SrfK
VSASEFKPSRRAALLLLPVGLAGCVPVRAPVMSQMMPQVLPARFGPTNPRAGFGPQTEGYYGELPDELHPVPAVDMGEVDPDVLRRTIRYRGPEAPGTIVVDTQARRLNLVQGDGTALQYGVGVGREGLDWSGRAIINRKAEWPRWIPTRDMIRREPEKNARWAGGMDGGLENPLGARALYLYQNGRDTYYRIHGTNDPSSIGTNVSSGCIRMINQDVIDLYERVPMGTPVLVV